MNAEELVELHREELEKYGDRHNLDGLAGRLQMGLDPAGMLAVEETSEIVKGKVQERYDAEAANVMNKLVLITNDMHQNGEWKYSNVNPTVEPAMGVFQLLKLACKEDHTRSLDTEGYSNNYQGVVSVLSDTSIESAIENMKEQDNKIEIEVVELNGKKVGFAGIGPWAFSAMPGRGFPAGVYQTGEAEFLVASESLNYEAFAAKHGLTAASLPEEPGKTAYRNDDDELVAKQVYGGLAVAFDKKVALDLATHYTHSPVS